MVVSGLHYAGYNGISPSDINFNRLRIQIQLNQISRFGPSSLNQTDMRRKTENHLIEKPAKWDFMCTRKCASIPNTGSFSKERVIYSASFMSASDASTLNVFKSTKREHVISLMILCLRAQLTAQHSAHMIVR